MFTTGQKVFAIIFFILFVVVAVIMYRKDKTLHREHYKGAYKVLIGFLLFIAFLFLMKYVLKR